ncbi:MAG: 5'-methylthioadenosine phosphorylase [Sphingomonadales bacterium 32-68-7]|nr:MAG: 5'-methylthioadenosine phosphorylase [Sphingomonadales bacterium 12-68-11]OYX08306.1 MAG: 5'-methylthioadenosine phosphorylase [Sphingomonadales bacterium 32-68-7]
MARAGGWHLGVLGGSGLYDPGAIDDAQEIAVASAFGEPSGPVVTGTLGGVRVTFLARHGAGHALSPSGVNYRANIDVLKRCGVTDVLAVSAVGSLREDLAPGDFVTVDQLIDRTAGRSRSFFGPSIAAHVGLADPTCPRLTGLAADAASEVGAAVHAGQCYIAIEGPQFSTRAESRLYRAWGGDVIGMTAMPEARLAREAELPYALLGMVTDYDCWRDGDAPSVEAILAQVAANAGRARDTLRRLAAALPAERASSPIDTALDGAIITPSELWDPPERARLDAVAGRVLALSSGS